MLKLALDDRKRNIIRAPLGLRWINPQTRIINERLMERRLASIWYVFIAALFISVLYEYVSV